MRRLQCPRALSLPAARLATAGLVTAALATFALVTAAPAASVFDDPSPALAEESAEDSTPPPIVGFVDTYSVTMVLVPVVVHGRDGRAVSGLEREQFSLRVGGRPVPIESFERIQAAPVSLVVLQDLSGSMAQLGRLEASRTALECLLNRSVPGDEIALASFAGERTLVEVPFTRDLDAVREAVSLWEPYGTTALHDAVSWLPELAAVGRPGRRAAIVITDGIDNRSVISPEIARAGVRRTELPVYVLGLRGPRPRGQSDAGEAEGLGPLRRLANSTGGRYYDLTDLAVVPEVCSEILSDLRNRYILGFSVTGRGENDDHPIQIELGRPFRSARMVHRRVYHGTPPAALNTP